MSAPHDTDLQGRMERIELLIGELEACPDPAARERARELVRILLDVHAAGLSEMLDLASQAGEPGRALVERFTRNGLVSSLLLLHGLHPVPVGQRVAEALERVRPSLRRQGGDAELLEVGGELVRVRLRGDPAAGPMLRGAVEEVVTAAADALALEFDEAWDSPASGRVSLPLLGGGS